MFGAPFTMSTSATSSLLRRGGGGKLSGGAPERGRLPRRSDWPSTSSSRDAEHPILRRARGAGLCRPLRAARSQSLLPARAAELAASFNPQTSRQMTNPPKLATGTYKRAHRLPRGGAGSRRGYQLRRPARCGGVWLPPSQAHFQSHWLAVALMLACRPWHSLLACACPRRLALRSASARRKRC